MEELLSQCAEATEIAGSNMISWLDSTLQFKLVIKNENSEGRLYWVLCLKRLN